MERVEVRPSISFTAIDLETANPRHSSPCAVGLVKVRDGKVVDRWSSLISPHESCGEFSFWNTKVHGLDSDSVRGAPGWEKVFPRIAEFVADDALLAHNAAFDRSVLRQTCALYDMESPPNTWLDTMWAAKRCLTLASYALPAVSNYLDLPSFVHHRADSDALQAALVGVALAERFPDSWHEGRLGPSVAAAPTLKAGDFGSLGNERPLEGQLVVFTGRLEMNTRAEASALVEHLGGVSQKGITRATTMVITGEFDPATLRPGTTLSSKLQKAREMAEAGIPIEILSEVEFLDRVALKRDELEAAIRAQRAQSRGSWIPDYVVSQASNLGGSLLAYNQWIRRALAHPDGRSDGGHPCVRCGGAIPADVYWLFAERRTCSGDCSDSLKRAAKRAWSHSGIQPPPAPEYSPSWGMGRG
ncbi:MAG: exonuclease domain-containing protein [Propionibacteriaceae bacterium]|nr:exonuclease domain-containing protein [Propionibacteriaceae bacterium]